ncbi:MAG: ShlB/FhaC/HecB family hemolysin secretion/activation protein [Chlorobium limicola]|nr:ShlB/FhaC/HecB family hemolysin secretion/activation protein [Chlorobium limicola]NTV99143.1 ShlB/FhaC/HecB family hemolysin secretion/activation protein [Chlorobiaceae bacterium]
MSRRFSHTLFKTISLTCVSVFLGWGLANASDQFAEKTVRRPAEVQRDFPVPSDRILVSGFTFSGNVSLSTAELQVLLSGYVGQSCDLQKLREAASTVTDAYRRRGMTLAKAYVPPQKIEGGVVNISVLEGRIGVLSVEGNRNYSTGFVRNILTSGHPERALTVEQLEKGLLLLNSNFADLKATANFSPGKEPGTSDVVVRVEDRSPFHVTLSGNNYGSEYVSRFRYSVQAEWVDALISGAHLAVSTTLGENIDDMNVVSGSYTFPVNSVGTMIALSAFDGNFDIGKDFAELGIHNEETSWDIGISHPLFKRRHATLTGKIGFRSSDARYYLLDELSSRDHVRVVYAQLQADQVFLGGRNFYDLTVSRGIGSALGGSGKEENIPTSRAFASNDFTRINLGIARYQPLSDVFSAVVRISGQWSDDNLVAGEQWLIGGVNSVHGYALGEASGDKGYLTSLALRVSPLVKKDLLQFAAYLDYGYSSSKYFVEGSKRQHELAGFGFGVASHLDTFASTDLRLDVGFPIDPSSNYLDESPVIYFETALRF